MNAKLTPATYESPNTEVFILEAEGAILQASTEGLFGNSPFEKGDDINI